MSARRDAGAAERPEPLRADRLRLLAALDDDSADSDVLLTAVQQTTVDLDGLGGMAYLRARSEAWDLQLMVSAGLPQAFVRLWYNISEDDRVAPALAVRDDRSVYVPILAVPGRTRGRRPVVLTTAAVLTTAGMAAVPLPGPEGPVGALCVVTPPDGEPGSAQWAFLEEVARWAAGRLRLAPPSPEGLAPTLLQKPEPGQEARAVVAGTWEWDLRTGHLAVSEGAYDAIGVDRKHLDGRIETWTNLIHPDDLPWVTEAGDRAIRTHGVQDCEYRVRRADGSYGWVRTRGQVVTDENGVPVRMDGTTWNTTQMHPALESVGRALLHMSDGFLSIRGDWRIGFVNAAAERLLGPSREMVGRPLWEVPGLRAAPGVEERCRAAVAEGEPVSFEVPGPHSDQWYHLRLVPVPDGLTVYVADITERRRREAEREAAERAAAERAALVGQLTRALAEAVTAQDVVTAVADSVLPAFGASGLLVATLDDSRPRIVGAVGHSRAFLDRLLATPVVPASTAEVLRTRAPLFTESAEEFTARHPRLAHLVAAGGKQAWVILPLIASGRPIGSCAISFDRPRRFSEDERTLLTALSSLVAQALERAGLFDDAVNRARALQRALLPRVLPSLPAVTAAARYLPAGPGTEVGGDWYDVIPLSSDRVALVVGDVMGHGMSEAATMGRLRTAARTLSELELPPEEILAHLGDIVAELSEDRFATCLYGVYDPVTGHFSYAGAGHPPPAIAHPDGTVTYPAALPNPPLGVAAPPYDTVDTSLPDGGLLALFTDGLVESRSRDIEDGMGHLAGILADALRRGRAGDLDVLCDAATSGLLPSGTATSDDAALLIARTHRLPSEAVATWSLPEDPVAAGEARERVRTQLAAWHLDGELATTTELLVSELVGNVVRHARGPIHLRLLRSRTLICEVSDASLTTPHIRRTTMADEGGRGLHLVAAMSQRWGTRHTATGKCIWTEQAIPVTG
ncbi:SpoIIE family protein phosphatase [Streptomyces sp. URMC 129]|uniref:SpoIIE family protein phosphatase n=1 Tax=Streptomyces sp. URMC 129 TaxID=3423407 RepID=UPI003F1AF2C2